MRTIQHHNARTATMIITLALVLTFGSATLAAWIAEGATVKCGGFITVEGHQQPACINGWPYEPPAPVPPLTSSNGDVSTRGFAIAPHTSGWLRCAPTEHSIGYDVAAVAPFALTEQSSAGHVTVFRTARDRYSNDQGRTLATVVLTRQTDHKPAALIANISNRRVEGEVICKHN
jgi:hypothetical protein